MTSAATRPSQGLSSVPSPTVVENSLTVPSGRSADQVLRDLVDRELPLITQLEVAERRLAERLLAKIDDSRQAAVYARTLREVVGVAGDVTRRVQALLLAGETLRAQETVMRAQCRRLAGDAKGVANED